MADSSCPPRAPRTHLVGIGGAGMAALATCLAELGHVVSGSDLRSTSALQALTARGIRVASGHAAENVAGADLLIASDAIPGSNLELKEANIRMIPVMRRAQMLDRICQAKVAVMVAGSHGKSSITAMLATVLERAGAAPSFALGADIPGLGGRRARLASGEHFVVEACEAFGNLSHYHPALALIANLDDEHCAHYGGQERLDAAFADFAGRATRAAVVNGDDPGVGRILHRLVDPITFGFDGTNAWRAVDVQSVASGSTFRILHNGRDLGRVTIPLHGRHMVLNALACVAACTALGIEFDTAADGLRRYTGIKRRWQEHDAGGAVRLIDDFAHHPAELQALFETSCAALPAGTRRLIAFQPQLYSRTKALLGAFARALARFDEAWVLDIDGAGETDGGEVSSHDLVAAIRDVGGQARSVGNVAGLLHSIQRHARPGDALITAGAGSIGEALPQMACQMREMFLAQRQPAVPSPSPIATAPAAATIAPASGTVLGLFAAQVAAQPQAIAVQAERESLSYGELDARADVLAKRLSAHGVELQDVVGVQADSSLELIVAIVAIAKAGAVYLPLDPNLPAARRKYMLRDARARFVLATIQTPVDQDAGVDVLLIEALAGTPQHHVAPTCIAVSAEHGAYICYTSGSTGKPKGVEIRHCSLADFCAAAGDRFAIGRGARMALNTAIGFDVSLGEIWMTLCAGAELHATQSSRPLVGAALRDFIERQQITHLAVTPTVLASVPAAPLASLRCVIAAGEACPAALAARWASGRRFFNAYGPTEATIYASAGECDGQLEVTIGTPLAHVQVRLLDDELREVVGGAVGELCIGGSGLARGYLGLPDETAARFIDWLAPSGQIERLYRSGDLARRNGEGHLCFIGRLDSQVKILGNRVELEEIEQALREADPAVLDVAVAFDSGLSGSARLVCFAVTREEEFDWGTARTALAQCLPPHMVPTEFVAIERMLMTPSGKKDRAGLLAAHAARRVRRGIYIAPGNDVEARVAAIWKTVLELDSQVGVDERFEWLGGDSLKALQIIMAVEDSFQIAIAPGYFGQVSTVQKMSIQLADLLWDRTARPAAAPGFRATRTYRELRDITAAWTGTRDTVDSIIVSVGMEQPDCHFILCLQNENELHAFGDALGAGFRVHALRSGHLLMQYTQDAVDQLCRHYVEEIEQAQLGGKLVLGGICQGALIAIRLAELLRERGHAIELVVLIEQSKLAPLDGEVAFYFSEDSHANPFRRFANAPSRFHAVYGSRYSLDIVPGSHGHIHEAPQVHMLAHKLRSRLGMVDSGRRLAEHTGLNDVPASVPCNPDAPRHAPRDMPIDAVAEATLEADAALISASALFDQSYYIAQLQSELSEAAAAAHYARWGWTNGLDPGPHFSTRGYLEGNYDVRDAQVNPLVHYLRCGASEGRSAHAVAQDDADVACVAASNFFDPGFYSAQLTGVVLSCRGAAAHYVRWGWRDGFDPGPHFSTAGYLQRHADVGDAGANPLLHYLRHGMHEGRSAWSESDVADWQGRIDAQADIVMPGSSWQRQFTRALRRGDRVAIHAHSRGHFAFRQFQTLFAQAFGALGIECTLESEVTNRDAPVPALRIVIAPHDFFHLEPQPNARDFADAVLFNSEQMPSVWFNRALPCLMAAPMVLDINFQTAACLAQLGARAAFVPLGIVPGNEIFRIQTDLAADPAVRGLPDDMRRPITVLTAPLIERGIDVLFIGSNSERRTRYFSEHSAFFAKNRCFIRLVDVIGPLDETHPNGIRAQAFAGLAQRARILLNIHHFDSPYFEWQRLVHYGFAQHCCVVTERCVYPPGVVPGVHCIEDDRHALPELMQWLLHDPQGQQKAQSVARAGHDLAWGSLRLDGALARLFGLEPALAAA